MRSTRCYVKFFSDQENMSTDANYAEQESELMDESELLDEPAEKKQGIKYETRVVTGKFKPADNRVKTETLKNIADAFVDINKRWVDKIDKNKVKPTRHVFGKDFSDTEHAMFYFMGMMNQFLPVEINIKSINGILHFYHTSFPRKRVPTSLWQRYKPSSLNENNDLEFELEINEGRASAKRKRIGRHGEKATNKNNKIQKRMRS